MRNKEYAVQLPIGCKWKLYMGRYESLRDAQRAYDVASFYTGNKVGEFYFEDTPDLLRQIRRPIKAFRLVSKEVRDAGYMQDLRSIALEVIRNDFQYNHWNNVLGDLPLPDAISTCYSEPASTSGEILIQVNYFRLAIAN